MSPVTHFLTGWALANAAGLERRDRALVAAASIIPDLDGFGIIIDIASRNTAYATDWYAGYHHVLGHNITFAMLCTLLALWLARQKWLTGIMVFLSFHLHLLGDVLGSRSPGINGEQWPIPYLQPFSDSVQWTWSGQWELNAWPNFVITIALLLLMFYWAWKRGYSPVELVSSRGDKVFVETLRNRFGEPAKKSI